MTLSLMCNCLARKHACIHTHIHTHKHTHTHTPTTTTTTHTCRWKWNVIKGVSNLQRASWNQRLLISSKGFRKRTSSATRLRSTSKSKQQYGAMNTHTLACTPQCPSLSACGDVSACLSLFPSLLCVAWHCSGAGGESGGVDGKVRGRH